MPPHRQFFDRRAIEREILHDRKWPRILVESTGEILSVAMAKRIMYLIRTGRFTFEHIPTKFYEEWNREIEVETVQALFAKEFTTTDLPLPDGDHLVCPDYPAIHHPDFVSGTIIPSGIYYELLNMRGHTSHFIHDYIRVRWGLHISYELIESIFDEWHDSLPTDREGRPIVPTGDARPPHPGARLGELPTELAETQERRTSFSVTPPLYEPRPVWESVVFRHPREVTDIDGHHQSFHNIGEEPNRLEHMEGVEPPPYEEVAPQNLDVGAAIPHSNTPHTQSSISTYSVFPQQISNTTSITTSDNQEPVVAAPEHKHPHWPLVPAILSKKFNKDDVCEYLFENFQGGDLLHLCRYHHLRPAQIVSPRLGTVRQELEQAAQIRNTAALLGIQSLFTIDTEEPTPWDWIDENMQEEMKEMFILLQKHLEDKLDYVVGMRPSINAFNLLNFIRHFRGLPVVDSIGDDSSTLTATILEMFQWQNDPVAMHILDTEYDKPYPWDFGDLQDLVSRIVEDTSKLSPPGIQTSSAPVVTVGRQTVLMSQPYMSNVDARFARHERIRERFATWWLTLQSFPSGIDVEPFPVAEALQEYDELLRQWRAAPDHQPPIWSVGLKCEQLLTSLEMKMFEIALTTSHLLRFDNDWTRWLRRYWKEFQSDIEEFLNDISCLRTGKLQVRPIPPVIPNQPVPSTRSCIENFAHLESELNWWLQSGEAEALFASLPPETDASPPLSVNPIEMRHKIRLALIDMDSWILDLGPMLTGALAAEGASSTAAEVNIWPNGSGVDHDGDHVMLESEVHNESSSTSYDDTGDVVMRSSHSPTPAGAHFEDMPPNRCRGLPDDALRMLHDAYNLAMGASSPTNSNFSGEGDLTMDDVPMDIDDDPPSPSSLLPRSATPSYPISFRHTPRHPNAAPPTPTPTSEPIDDSSDDESIRPFPPLRTTPLPGAANLSTAARGPPADTGSGSGGWLGSVRAREDARRVMRQNLALRRTRRRQANDTAEDEDNAMDESS